MKSTRRQPKKSSFWYTEAGKTYLEEHYSKKEKSACQIAEENDTYATIIRRALKYHNIHIRTKSEAQINAIASGRIEHPTKGKKREQKVKNKIGDSVRNNWENMSDDKYYKIVDQRKEQWAKIPEEQKKELMSNAARAMRKTADEGSALEKYLLNALQIAGLNPTFHKEKIVQQEKMHVDIYLASEGIAIEIDGPTHFLPIFGEEALKKTRVTDDHKTGLLLIDGNIVLRVRNLMRKNSEAAMREFAKYFMQTINAIITNPPRKIEDRLITIDYGTLDNWKEMK